MVLPPSPGRGLRMRKLSPGARGRTCPRGPSGRHAPIVRRIYNDSRNGISVRQISDAILTEYPSVVTGRTKKRLMRWTENNVLKILRNRLYTGYMETMGRGRRLRNEQGSGTWLQTHEAIIEPALFDRARAHQGAHNHNQRGATRRGATHMRERNALWPSCAAAARMRKPSAL